MNITPDLSIQIDTAVFPDSSTVEIGGTLISFDIDLNVDADNAAATVNLTSMPPDAAETYRLYIYESGELIFHGSIPPGGLAWGADGTATIGAQGTMAKMRHAWGGEDRVYDSISGDTDTSTAQNWVEASGVDVSLTSIEGEGRLIGTAQDVVIHGGNIGFDGNPTQADSMLDALRLLDKSVIPNFVTFETGAGVVTRRPRALGVSTASFADGSGGAAWGFTHTGVPNSIVNKWLISGLAIAGIPTEASSSASNALLPAPFEFAGDQLTSYFIDDPTWAQDLADAKLAETNAVLHQVGWTTAINNDASLLGTTATVSSARRALDGQDVYITGIKHHADQETATSTFSAEFRV